MVNKFTLNNKPNDSVVAGTQLGISVDPSTGAVLKATYTNVFASPLYSTIQASGSGGVALKTSGGTTVMSFGGGGSTVIDVPGQIQVDNGISFDSGSNLLDYYEVGTWTPVLIGSSTTGTNSYQTQIGEYTRIGDMVHLRILLILDGTSGALDSTGTLLITGMPFTIGSNRDNGVGDVVFQSGASLTASFVNLVAIAQDNEQIVMQGQGTSGTSNIGASQATDSLSLRLSIWYQTNE